MRDINKSLSQNLLVSTLHYSNDFLHTNYRSFMKWQAGIGIEGFSISHKSSQERGWKHIYGEMFQQRGFVLTNLEWR